MTTVSGPSGSIQNAGYQELNDDFEMPDASDALDSGPVSDSGSKLSQAKVDSSPTEPSLAAHLRSVCTYKRSDNIFHQLGRLVLNAFHYVFGARTASVSDVIDNLSSDQKSSDLSVSIMARAIHHTIQPSALKNLGQTPTVGFTQQEIGLALGLKGQIGFKEFSGEGLKQLYPGPDVEPRLDDIKQNPALQNCWFLSAVGGLLASRGHLAIKEMIIPPNPQTSPPTVNVRLGDNVYAVPLGDLTDAGGRKAVSDSAPWVRVLEMAMQMHLLNAAIHNSVPGETIMPGASQINMAYRDIHVGLQALVGAREKGNVAVLSQAEDPGDVQENLTKIKEALGNGYPVVLGHIPQSESILTKVLGSLKDGLSPGHAVSVLDVNKKDSKLTVLDPYGKIRILDFEVLTRCTVAIGRLPESGVTVEDRPRPDWRSFLTRR